MRNNAYCSVVSVDISVTSDSDDQSKIAATNRCKVRTTHPQSEDRLLRGWYAKRGESF